MSRYINRTDEPIHALCPKTGTLTNSAAPNQTPHNAAPDQVPHCLCEKNENYFLNEIKVI